MKFVFEINNGNGIDDIDIRHFYIAIIDNCEGTPLFGIRLKSDIHLECLQPVAMETCIVANPGVPSPHSPTPSPASSIGSNSSGYSSGDRRSVRVSQCIAVPISLHTALQKQHNFYSNLIASFSYWEEADKLIFSGGNKGIGTNFLGIQFPSLSYQSL